MFDIAFTELLVIGVIALLVIGPERLPKVARTAGHLFGRFQRYVANVKGDIQREMETADLAKLKTEVQDAARSFEQSVNTQVQQVESEARAVQESLEVQPGTETAAEPPAGEPAVSSAPETQSQLDLALGVEQYTPPSTQQKLIN